MTLESRPRGPSGFRESNLCRDAVCCPAQRPRQQPCRDCPIEPSDDGAAVITGAMSDVTQILYPIERGDPTAAEQLLPLVHEAYIR